MLDKNNPQPTLEKETKKYRGWSIVFQFRIYFGFILTIVSWIFLYKSNFTVYDAFYIIILYTPLAICLIMFYEKRKTFRIWYIIGIVFISISSLLSGTIPTASTVIEVFIIVALYKWNYVNETFTTKEKSKGIYVNKKHLVTEEDGNRE